jgi:hypothetical protein
MVNPVEDLRNADRRYKDYFHELDAWTEYWDIYHPETKGYYYFGNNKEVGGLLTWFLPRERFPPAFQKWTNVALLKEEPDIFLKAIRVPQVCSAIAEVDELVGQIFNRHFGDPTHVDVQKDYLNAMFRFAVNDLLPAPERDALIAPEDPRKSTAGRHTLAGDLMWFAWALQLEAAYLLRGIDQEHPRRTLMLAGVGVGCAANFAWLGHRRTRPEYSKSEATTSLLKEKGMQWAADFHTAREEVHALFRIREWGEDD